MSSSLLIGSNLTFGQNSHGNESVHSTQIQDITKSDGESLVEMISKEQLQASFAHWSEVIDRHRISALSEIENSKLGSKVSHALETFLRARIQRIGVALDLDGWDQKNSTDESNNPKASESIASPTPFTLSPRGFWDDEEAKFKTELLLTQPKAQEEPEEESAKAQKWQQLAPYKHATGQHLLGALSLITEFEASLAIDKQ